MLRGRANFKARMSHPRSTAGSVVRPGAAAQRSVSREGKVRTYRFVGVRRFLHFLTFTRASWERLVAAVVVVVVVIVVGVYACCVQSTDQVSA